MKGKTVQKLKVVLLIQPLVLEIHTSLIIKEISASLESKKSNTSTLIPQATKRTDLK
jgi:hypothetical protein